MFVWRRRRSRRKEGMIWKKGEGNHESFFFSSTGRGLGKGEGMEMGMGRNGREGINWEMGGRIWIKEEGRKWGRGWTETKRGGIHIHTYIHSYIGMSLRFTFNPYRVPIRERRLFFFFSLIKEL